jgi:N-acetylglucosamine-6-phosphate deacetylase
LCTHVGNAGHPTLPKVQNYIWEQLAEDRLNASFIADGYHLPSAFLKVALRAKGSERSILISDAVMPAMCAPGTYRLGDVEVELQEGGRVVLLGGTRLAGSALRMDMAVANAVRLGGVSLRDAVTMACINPARVTRVAGRQRGITTGEKADFVRFEWDETAKSLRVIETVLSGETVFRDGGSPSETNTPREEARVRKGN